jgi:hypothetical protein
MSEWTPELKERVVAEYKEAKPTPENSVEIINEIVENLSDDMPGATVNGVRMILIKAGVYIKKEEAKKTNGSNGASKRVNKADSINELAEFIKSQGIEPDTEILGKLTGKAAIYFTGVLREVTEQE